MGVIERKGPERRRDFVQDVTAEVASKKVDAKRGEKAFVAGAAKSESWGRGNQIPLSMQLNN